MRAWPITLLLLLVPACGSNRNADPPMPITETPSTTSSAAATVPAPVTSATAVASAVTPDALPVDPADIARENALGWKLLGQTGKATENALVSGASLRQALAPLLAGARGPTADEMAQALGLEKDPAPAIKAEIGAWESAKGRPQAGAARGVELAVANRLWIANGFTLLPDYAKQVGAFGATAPETVDFARPEARTTINAWVSEQTRTKIPELLPAGAVDRQTRLAVTNAIWFKGRWSQPFPEGATKPAPFKGAKTTNVPTMEVTDSFRYGEVSGTKVVELRYADSELAMLVALPQAGKKVDPAALDGATLASQRVHVSLPKFGFKSGGPMKDALASLGMKTAFTDRADFTGIADAKAGEKLSVGQVFHQTWIAVDERGTEAAAATGGTMHTTAMPMGPVAEFKADHPFWFAIRETKTGRILFTGRVTDPK